MKEGLKLFLIGFVAQGIALFSRGIGSYWIEIGFFVVYFLGSLMLGNKQNFTWKHLYFFIPMIMDIILATVMPDTLNFWVFFFMYLAGILGYVLGRLSLKLPVKFGLAVIFCLAIVWYMPKISDKMQGGDVDITIAEFKLTKLNGTVVKPEDLKGKVVLLELWYTGCGVCVLQMQKTETIYQELKDKVVFYHVDVVDEPLSKIESFYKEYGITVPTLKGDRELLKRLPTSGVPQLFIFDRDGKLAYYRSGYVDSPGQNIERDKLLDIIEG